MTKRKFGLTAFTLFLMQLPISSNGFAVDCPTIQLTQVQGAYSSETDDVSVSWTQGSEACQATIWVANKDLSKIANVNRSTSQPQKGLGKNAPYECIYRLQNSLGHDKGEVDLNCPSYQPPPSK